MKTLLVAMIVIALVSSQTTATWPFGKVIEVIQSDIPFEYSDVDCWTENAHVGRYSLIGGESIRFTFHRFILNKYYCDFKTPHGSGRYGVYTNRIDSLCNGYCVWHITKEGLCLAKVDGSWYCQDWQIPPPYWPRPPYHGSGVKSVTSL